MLDSLKEWTTHHTLQWWWRWCGQCSCLLLLLMCFPDALWWKKEEHKQSRLLAQSHCWQVSVNVLQAFKEAVSNCLDLDLFVVKGRLKWNSRSRHLASCGVYKGLIAGNPLDGLADGPEQRGFKLLFSLTHSWGCWTVDLTIKDPLVKND